MAFKVVLFAAIILTGLVSGLFYSYSVSVNGGLARLADSNYLRAMQSINRVILNPLFFLSFLGTIGVLPVTAWLCYHHSGTGTSFYLLLAACLVYIAGVFIVTVTGNVPLNEMLDKLDITTAGPGQLKEWRARFEIPWNRYNTIRTIASFAAFLLTAAAVFKR